MLEWQPDATEQNRLMNEFKAGRMAGGRPVPIHRAATAAVGGSGLGKCSKHVPAVPRTCTYPHAAAHSLSRSRARDETRARSGAKLNRVRMFSRPKAPTSQIITFYPYDQSQPAVYRTHTLSCVMHNQQSPAGITAAGATRASCAQPPVACVALPPVASFNPASQSCSAPASPVPSRSSSRSPPGAHTRRPIPWLQWL